MAARLGVLPAFALADLSASSFALLLTYRSAAYLAELCRNKSNFHANLGPCRFVITLLESAGLDQILRKPLILQLHPSDRRQSILQHGCNENPPYARPPAYRNQR